MFGLTLTELRFAGYAFLLAAVLGGVVYWHHEIFTEGAQSTETKYVMRDAKAAQAARDRIDQLEAAARATEAQHAAKVAAITTTLRKGNADGLAKKDVIISGLRAGTAKLYVATVCPSAGDRSATATPEQSSAPINGTGNAGYIGTDDAQVLVTEFARSDDRARKVTALQALVLDQIATCNQ